ncbi:hypothetical protein ACFQ6C_26400 [Streptomyces sp. NPDC056454]|uniref:hypothetical protein n=1 Tax=Streptomyces sp. NPDC056454 TaxID=3345823 RepID=UPI00369AAD1D
MSRTRLAEAPYNQSGDLITYVGTNPDRVHEWRPNTPFPTMLILEGTTRGMSAARFVWRSDKGHRYEMFMMDAVDLMKRDAPIWHGTADTWWMVQKRGKNYGIRRATHDDLKTAGHVPGPKSDCRACDGVAYGYESWCPLPPTPDVPHQFRGGPLTRSCLCGLGSKDNIHTHNRETL